MKMKKTISKMAALLLVFVIACSLCVLNFAVAGAVEPQSPAVAEGEVTPNSVPNDGASVLSFSWHITDWEGIADYYTFAIHVSGSATPEYIQYSNIPNDVFDGITEPLLDISGMTGEQHIYNPEGDGFTHDWTVPADVDEEAYWGWVNMYVEDQAEPEASVLISFDIMQATGNLEIHKFRTGTAEGLDDWDFSISGPEAGSGSTNATGILIFSGIEVGDYDVTETVKGGWVCTTPGMPAIMEDVTVPFDDTVVVEFYNQELIGDLTIFKYEDINGNGVQDGTEAGLDDWDFDISGPGGDYSETTAGGGYITLSGLSVGEYTITEDLKDGWRCTDPGPAGQCQATVEIDGPATVDFGNQQLGSLRIFKYNDEDGEGDYDAGEVGLGGWEFTVSGVSGVFTTASDGYITVPNVVPGSHTVTETLKTGWQCTDPDSSRQKTVDVTSGGTENVQFGNYMPPHLVPALSQWGIIALSSLLGAALLLVIARRRRPV